jgi:hypothetical protein
LLFDWTRITHSISILAGPNPGDAAGALKQLKNNPTKTSHPVVVTLVRAVHIDARHPIATSKNVRLEEPAPCEGLKLSCDDGLTNRITIK